MAFTGAFPYVVQQGRDFGDLLLDRALDTKNPYR